VDSSLFRFAGPFRVPPICRTVSFIDPSLPPTTLDLALPPPDSRVLLVLDRWQLLPFPRHISGSNQRSAFSTFCPLPHPRFFTDALLPTEGRPGRHEQVVFTFPKRMRFSPFPSPPPFSYFFKPEDRATFPIETLPATSPSWPFPQFVQHFPSP